MKNIFNSFFKKNSKKEEDYYKNLILPKIESNYRVLNSKDSISFLHHGHLGDIINSLPVIKEISKKKTCSLYIQVDKKIPSHVKTEDHLFGSVYLNDKVVMKLLPLLKEQSYINNAEIYTNQKIDIDLNFFRELPINFNIDSVRWYSHLTGCFPNLSKRYLEVGNHSKFVNYISIMRSLRRQNKFINYSFLSNYKNLVFIGLEKEYFDLKKKINNLEYYNSKDFLELAMIIKNSKLFIGNLSFGYTIAEALKIPRLLESSPNFPLVYPNGLNAYDFYFQNHFESKVKELLNN